MWFFSFSVLIQAVALVDLRMLGQSFVSRVNHIVDHDVLSFLHIDGFGLLIFC